MGFLDRRERERRIDRLGQLALLSGCTRRQLACIDELGTTLDVHPGRTLTREGTPGRECFLVVAGAASARRAEHEVGVLPNGTVAGELALLDGTARSATVVATTPMRLVVLSATEFHELLGLAPCVADLVLETAAERREALDLAGAR